METITIPLQDYLNLCWHHREYFNESTERIKQLQLDGDRFLSTRLYHIQYEDEKGEQLSVPRVWRMDCWQRAYEKVQQDRVTSELSRQERELTKEQLTKITDHFCKLGLPAEMAAAQAYKIYTLEQVYLCPAYGIQADDIIWPSKIKEHCKNMLPQLKADGIL